MLIIPSTNTFGTALIYVVWNNGFFQPAMGYWLKSFNATPPPVPGTTYTVAQINDRKSKLAQHDQYVLYVVLTSPHSSNCHYWYIRSGSIRVGPFGRRASPGTPLAFYLRWCRD